jgi:hypothetical protein
MKQTASRAGAGLFFGLLFNPEDGGDIFLRNFGSFSTDYIALYPRRSNYLYPQL